MDAQRFSITKGGKNGFVSRKSCSNYILGFAQNYFGGLYLQKRGKQCGAHKSAIAMAKIHKLRFELVPHNLIRLSNLFLLWVVARCSMQLSAGMSLLSRDHVRVGSHLLVQSLDFFQLVCIASSSNASMKMLRTTTTRIIETPLFCQCQQNPPFHNKDIVFKQILANSKD